MEFFASLSPAVWAMVVAAALLGVALGWLIWGTALARHQRIAFELAHAQTAANEAADRRRQLERELASARDQLKPLADEVERLRREVGRAANRAEAAAPLASVPAAGAFRDLRLLKGVGDNLAARLAAEGVPDIPALAALDPADVARVDAALGDFAGRIARDQLDAQARLLDAGRVAEFEARFGRLSG
jgi:predicted flap endonuclease-1-like 5' DNA nuclease